MRGVTYNVDITELGKPISTHTPHARRDALEAASTTTASISTHTPHARRDWAKLKQSTAMTVFQLTRLMRGVTPVHEIKF